MSAAPIVRKKTAASVERSVPYETADAARRRHGPDCRCPICRPALHSSNQTKETAR